MLKRRRALAAEEKLVALGLGGGRIAIGVGLWAAPKLTLKALGFGPQEGDSMALARIAASRDIAMGVWIVSSLGDRDRLRDAIAGAAFCDAGDTVAFAALAARGGDDLGAGLRGALAAGPATAAGVWLHSRLG